QALAIFQHLRTSHPNMTDFAFKIGAVHANLGRVLAEAGDNEAALEAYGQAIDHLAAVPAGQQGYTEARQFLRRAYAERAATLTKLGRHADAASDRERARTIAAGTR